MKRLLVILLLTLSCLLSIAQEAPPTTFKTYSFGFSDSASVEQTLQALVGPDGSVVMDDANRRALVVATEEEHVRIAEVMKQLNHPPKNVRIEVRFEGGGTSADTMFGVSGAGRVTRKSGMSSTTITIQPQIHSSSLTHNANVMQTILVASGRTGVLRVGEDVPYLDWLMSYGLHAGYFQSELNWQKIGSYLIVEPVVVGEGPMIRIRLTPELRGLVDGNPYHTKFAGVSTEVVVMNGQTFQVGGVAKDAEFYSRFLVGVGRSGTAESIQIYLTPHIVGPNGL